MDKDTFPREPRDEVEREASGPQIVATEWCDASLTPWSCSRPPGHSGDHVAGNGKGEIWARWPSEPATASFSSEAARLSIRSILADEPASDAARDGGDEPGTSLPPSILWLLVKALREERDEARAALSRERVAREGETATLGQALREAKDRCTGLSERVKATEAEFERAQGALRRIARWFGEFPPTGRTWDDGSPMSYSAAFGSNGERDYMRQLALDALSSGPAPESAPETCREQARLAQEMIGAADRMIMEAAREAGITLDGREAAPETAAARYDRLLGELDDAWNAMTDEERGDVREVQIKLRGELRDEPWTVTCDHNQQPHRAGACTPECLNPHTYPPPFLDLDAAPAPEAAPETKERP